MSPFETLRFSNVYHTKRHYKKLKRLEEENDNSKDLPQSVMTLYILYFKPACIQQRLARITKIFDCASIATYHFIQAVNNNVAAQATQVDLHHSIKHSR